jgi:sec-independent protein translocase protein TatA
LARLGVCHAGNLWLSGVLMRLFLPLVTPSFRLSRSSLARAPSRTEDFMGSLSIWHWIIVLAVGLLVFGGRGKISDLMGDVAIGIKAFKKGMSDDDTADAPKSDAPIKTIDHQTSGDTPRRTESDSKVERSLS